MFVLELFKLILGVVLVKALTDFETVLPNGGVIWIENTPLFHKGGRERVITDGWVPITTGYINFPFTVILRT